MEMQFAEHFSFGKLIRFTLPSIVMMIFTSILIGVILAIVGFVFIELIAVLLGAEGEMVNQAALYGRVLSVSLPLFIIQNTVVAGVANIVLDAFFIVVFEWDLFGAAIATAISQILGGIVLAGPLSKIFVGYDAELLAVVVTVVFLITKRDKYKYY